MNLPISKINYFSLTNKTMPRANGRRVRIKTELVEETKENVPPIPFGTQTNTTPELDVIFSRVLDPVTAAQRKYLAEQITAFDDEKFLLQRIAGDFRDLLNSMYEYELRVKPDPHVPLFFDREYQNFRQRIQCYDMMKLVVDKYALFHDGIEDEEEEEEPEPADTESLAETIIVMATN